MKHEKVRAFLESLRNDPKALEMIARIPEPENHEGRIRAYEKVAKELGYDLSDTDLDAYITDHEKYLQERARAAAEKIVEIPEDELVGAAGGGDHPDCKDTFKDKENCWVNDGCDAVNNHYSDYQCHYTDVCYNHMHSTCGDDAFGQCGSMYRCLMHYYCSSLIDK